MTERGEDRRLEAARWLAAQVRWEDRLGELEECFRPPAPAKAVAAAA